MKRILYISAFQPSLKMQAGNKTTYDQLEKLGSKYLIDLIVVQRKKLSIQEEIFKKLNDFDFIRLSFYDYFLVFFISVFKVVPIRYLSRFSINLFLKLKKINLKKYEFVQLDYTQMFWISLFLPKEVKIKLLCSDILTQFASRHNFFNKFLLGRFFYFENLFFTRADKIILLCQKDLKILECFFGIDPKKLLICPPSISNFTDNFKRNKSLIVDKSILFWGSMSRPENYNSVLNFINHVFIKLLQLDNKLILYIVGSNPNKRLLKFSKKFPNNIVVTGFVDNPEKYFQKAALGIAPISSGAGIKVKVLEMLKCQIPVFSTIIGAEGIPTQRNLHVLPDLDCFYSEIINFFNIQH